MEKYFFSVAIIILVISITVVLSMADACNKRGGTLVRGIFGYECIKPEAL